MPVISVLEQQTSETLADAASRLQTKDAKIKAASLEIASLEKELAESLLKESKLTADLIKEQDTGREANARYAKLESSCEAQLKALKAKDTLIGTAEDHAKKLDVNRLKELEKAGATLSSMKSNHQSEVEAFRAELSALRGQMNVQHKDHEKEMEGARQRMQKSHEELLSENEFNHIADKTNQLNALRTELEASYTVVREKDAIYLLDFKDKHAADVTKLRLTYEKETKAALAAQKEELNGEIARTRIEADRIKEAALQSSIEETSKRRDEELIRFRENSSVQSEEMMASAKRELEKSLEGQRKELMAARDILLADRKYEEQSTLAALVETHTTLLNAVKVQSEKDMKELQRILEAESFRSDSLQKELADRQIALQSLHFNMEASDEAVRRESEAALTALKAQQKAEIKNLQSTMKGRLVEEQAAIASVRQLLELESLERIASDNRLAQLENQLAESVKTHDIEIIDTRATLNSKMAELESQSVKNKQTHAHEMADLKASSESLITELEGRIASGRFDANSVSAERDDLERRIAEMEITAKKDKKAYTADIAEAKAASDVRIAELERELSCDKLAHVASVDQMKAAFKVEEEDFISKMAQERVQFCSLVNEKSDIEGILSKLRIQMLEGKAHEAELMIEKASLESRIADLECLISDDKMNTNEVMKAKNSLESLVAELESQSVKNKQTHANEMADLKASSESLITELEGRIASGRSDANSVSAERDDLERRIAEMEITAKKDKVIREELIAATTASDLRVNEYSCQLQAEKAYSKAVSADNAALDLKLAELERLILEGRADYENQSERIFASESKLIKMEEQARIDKVAFDDLMVEKLAVKRHMGHLESADADKAEQLKDLSAYKASSESLISELEGRIASGRSDANSVSAERDDLERRIAEMEITAKKDKKAYTADIAEAKAASDVRMAELDNKLVAALKEKRLSQDRVDNLLSQVKTGQAHTEEQKLAIDALHSRIADLECLISDDKMNTNEVMKAKNSLESLVAELEGQVKRDYKTYELEMVRARAVMDGTVSDLERQLAEEKERHTTELVKAKVASDNHLVEIKCEMNNTVKALEGSARLQLDALRCELLKEEAARQAVKIKEIVRFKDLERAAALATSEEGKAAKVATLEKDHCVALNDLRDELSEQHSRQLTQALSALHDRKELDIQAAVSAAKSEVDSELQCSSRHLVETLGQEGRDALEIQRAMLDAVRVADREKASKEIQALSFRHEEVLSAVSVEHSRALQRALEEQRGELRKAFDLLVAKKERASEIAQEDAKAIHLLERDQLLAAQRVQHVRTDNHSPA